MIIPCCQPSIFRNSIVAAKPLTERDTSNLHHGWIQYTSHAITLQLSKASYAIIPWLEHVKSRDNVSNSTDIHAYLLLTAALRLGYISAVSMRDSSSGSAFLGLVAAVVLTSVGLGLYTEPLKIELVWRTFTFGFIGLNVGLCLLIVAFERSARFDYAPVAILPGFVGGAIAVLVHDGNVMASEEESKERRAAFAEAVIPKLDEDIIVVDDEANQRPRH